MSEVATYLIIKFSNFFLRTYENMDIVWGVERKSLKFFWLLTLGIF